MTKSRLTFLEKLAALAVEHAQEELETLPPLTQGELDKLDHFNRAYRRVDRAVRALLEDDE